MSPQPTQSQSEIEQQFADELEQLKGMLERFDSLWCQYEQKYVFELMVIENDARRFILESINIEAILKQPHMQSVLKRDEFDTKRKTLLDLICQVNAVANEEGKGRDDFSFDIMERAEQIVKDKPETKTQLLASPGKGFSKAVKSLAGKVV